MSTYSVTGKAQDAITWRLIVTSVDTEEDAAHYAHWLSVKYPKNVYRIHENNPDVLIATFIRGRRT